MISGRGEKASYRTEALIPTFAFKILPFSSLMNAMLHMTYPNLPLSQPSPARGEGFLNPLPRWDGIKGRVKTQ